MITTVAIISMTINETCSIAQVVRECFEYSPLLELRHSFRFLYQWVNSILALDFRGLVTLQQHVQCHLRLVMNFC